MYAATHCTAALTSIPTAIFVIGSDVFQLRPDIFTALRSTESVLNANDFRFTACAVATDFVIG